MSIEFWTWNTPNGRKISVALEEMGLAYAVKPVNISKNEQFNPEFLKFSPNNRIPAIVDPDGPGGKPITVFESGAILIYLGAKTGKFWRLVHDGKKVLMLFEAEGETQTVSEMVCGSLEECKKEIDRLKLEEK